MANRSITSVLSALGVDGADERLYYRLRPVSGHTLDGVASLLQTSVEELVEQTAALRSLGLVGIDAPRQHEPRLMVPSLAEAVARLVSREAAAARDTSRRLGDLSAAVPQLVAATTRPAAEEVADILPLDGELSSGGNALELLQDMVRNSRGEMLWLRPDAWRMPRESAVAKLLEEAMATGRRSRAIYPARALQEAPEALLARARLGEQIRVISDLPTRMFVLGDAHAVLPEPLGFADEPRVHIRQRSVVAALRMWFEAMWHDAMPVPQLDLGEARPDLRRFVLEQLAQGATDEQIAPKLGMSLRTVRRRVAALMIELGADTRFQAGVEAVRRGWI